MVARRSSLHRLAIAGAIALVLTGVLRLAGATLPQCATPAASAPAFARGSENTVAWTQPTGLLQGGGFQIEVATAPELEPNGSFIAANVTAIANVGSSERKHTFEDLPERQLFYHLYAKKSSSCERSAWSNVVSTAQDATSPTVTISTPPMRMFVLEPVTVEGTADDPAGADVPAGSGVKSVRVSLANTTPGLGPIFLQPPRRDVPVVDGAWTATFEAVKPGTYIVTATAFDNVGNQSRVPAAISIVVVGAP